METYYACIVKGVVVSVEVVTDEFAKANDTRYKEHVKVTGPCGIGYTYSSGIFTTPQPYASWLLKKNKWEAPIKQPEGDYGWDEETKAWVERV